MSQRSVISVENLGKVYRLNHQAERPQYHTFREVMMSKLKGMVRPTDSTIEATTTAEDFWALKDVSFKLGQGEVVGIIGRNGAGKSTLLKILSRITEPSRGRVRIKGRVASLLEVGTGFHPELTGRENIYLNGAILGMSRSEIKRKFDEIVDFAEVEKFLDTPVKRYSSGMYVRLAFAVAAHLEPEILVVDEVLAVGDAEFQQKCLGKMQSVAQGEGRSILFVSHNMSAVQHLCSRVVFLKSGSVVADGPPEAIIGGYLSDAKTGKCINVADWEDRKSSDEARITMLEIDDGAGGTAINLGGNIRVRIHAQIPKGLMDPTFGVLVHDSLGASLLDVRSIHDGLRMGSVKGSTVVEVTIPKLGLYAGRYLLSPYVMDSSCSKDLDFPRMCATINVNPAPGPYGDLKLDSMWGKYYVPSIWKSGANS